MRKNRLLRTEHPEIRRMICYRDSCAPAKVSFPAAALADTSVARWLRECRLAVDVRTLAELHSAISVGIHPVLMTVHADRLDIGEVRRASAAGVGRVVLSGPDQIAPLRTKRRQNVLLRMTTSGDAGAAADAVVRCRSTALIGLICEIDTAPVDLVDLIAQMDDIRRRYGIVLTRLILGLGSVVASDEIDEAVGDACAALRFPRPAIVMSDCHWPRSA